ncbi:MAG: tRNA epoxyqueuosine(34) reductase QueG [bacterium]
MALKSGLADRIRDHALRLGFDVVGITPAQRAARATDYFNWLEQGRHGDMAWLARDPERRADPQRVLPGARSMVIAGLSYFVADPPDEFWNDPMRGRIARYAWGRDYHDVVLPMLEELACFIGQEAGRAVLSRAYVDTGPVLEREHAARAGLGFIGKNTLLIHPRLGSCFFLGEILVDLELNCDELPPEPVGACGSCRRCQDVCPTHAFPAPYIIDSRLCISYLTIEIKAAIPSDLRPLMKNWIFGCDECQLICPWVKQYARPGAKRFLSFDPDRFAPRLIDLMQLDDAGFRDQFGGTPIVRIKRRGLLCNVAVALGNAGDASALPVLENALHDPEPLIREHAQWAMDRIIR